MNRPRRFEDARLYYFPRLRPDVVDRRIGKLGPGDRVQAAISHMDQGPFARQLAEAAKRGAVIDLVVHDTARRVPRGAHDLPASRLPELTTSSLKSPSRRVHPDRGWT